MVRQLLTWPPSDPPTRFNILRRARYCVGVTRCVHEDLTCCCGGICCPCPTPYYLTGVFTQVSPSSPLCENSDTSPPFVWDGATFTMTADPDEPIDCPQAWIQDAKLPDPIIGSTCEFDCEIDCTDERKYILTIKEPDPGTWVPSILEPDRVVCCDAGTGVFLLEYTVFVGNELACCGTEEGTTYEFKITLTGDCPTPETTVVERPKRKPIVVPEPPSDLPKDVENWLNGVVN